MYRVVSNVFKLDLITDLTVFQPFCRLAVCEQPVVSLFVVATVGVLTGFGGLSSTTPVFSATKLFCV